MPEKNTEATERTDSAENADAKGAQTSAEPRDDIVTTRHTLSLGDRELVYTARAGRIVLRKEVLKDGAFDGHKPKAEVFLTSFTLVDADPYSPPVTFAFNWGPGSSGISLASGMVRPV